MKAISNTFLATFLFSAIFFLSFWVNDTHGFTLEQQTYLDARQAINTNKNKEYKQLRKKLDHYPLAIYLDFNQNIDRILKLHGKQAIEAIAEFKSTPLYNTARHRYLMTAGQNHHWQDILAFTSTAPKAVQLQCFYYLAQLHNGDKNLAYDKAQTLWMSAYSRPDECDPLFKAWKQAGHQTKQHLWSRMQLSFDAKQSQLLAYLVRQYDSNNASLLLAVYRDPKLVSQTQKFNKKYPQQIDIAMLGLKKLSRIDPQQAFALYQRYQQQEAFNQAQQHQLEYYLSRQALIEQVQQVKSMVDTLLPALNRDDLYEMRLRWAIKEQDNNKIKRYLALLGKDTLNEPRWQYWLARNTHSEQPEQSNKILESLSNQRNFYGFISSQHLTKSINLNNKASKLDHSQIALLKKQPGLSRVTELIELKEFEDARSEWRLLLQNKNKKMQAQYARYAISKGWNDLSVAASIQAGLWDDIELRFPFARQETFAAASNKYQVNIDEIRAIARRESAFYPRATSPVGARGLMQLMPATARRTAKKNQLAFTNIASLYQPEINVQLGSAYYASLLKQFDNNRILATAAYNAGPSRVRAWLKESAGKLNAISFIETIPYKETREYVQAVLSYRMIYESLQNKESPILSKSELNFNY